MVVSILSVFPSELQTRPIKKSAQDNSAQVVPRTHRPINTGIDGSEVIPISEDNSAQIAPTLEELSAHENQARHLLMY